MRPSAALVLVALLVGCGEDGKPAGETTVVTETTVAIETGERTVRVAVEVADTDEERARGLMERDELPEDEGMLFLYEDETSGGFWMKNTLIPLSIAFFDRDGKILRILDMEPCEADPCPAYDPQVSYRGALEVNKGAFARWGVSAGDRIRVER